MGCRAPRGYRRDDDDPRLYSRRERYDYLPSPGPENGGHQKPVLRRVPHMITGWLRLGLFAVPSYAAEVVGHVDGDTVAMRVQVWPAGDLVIPRVLVWLRGIDTLELRQAACGAERAAGRQATSCLTAILPTWAQGRAGNPHPRRVCWPDGRGSSVGRRRSYALTPDGARGVGRADANPQMDHGVVFDAGDAPLSLWRG